MSRLVAGMFNSRSAANDAIRSLLADGVPRTGISLLMSDATRRREFAAEPAGVAGELHMGDVDRLLVDSIMLAGVGVFASGPIVDALLSHPSAQTLREALCAVEISNEQAERLTEAVHHGGIVITVDAPFGDQTLTQANLDGMGDPDLGVTDAKRAAAAIADPAADIDGSWGPTLVAPAMDPFHTSG